MSKKIFFTLASCIMLHSCSNNIIPDLNEQLPKQEIINNRTITEALTEAAKFINISPSKNSDISISYITNHDIHEDKSRSQYLKSDTIAYVINAPNNGFAIIAYNKSIKPILAYSDMENFTLADKENNLAYKYFISRLPGYIEQKTNNTTYEQPTWQTVYVGPYIKFKSWNQRAPFSKYVELNHSGSPTGCVPLACVRAMIYAKDYLKYDGLAALSNYNFASIRTKLEAYSSNPPQEDDPTYIHWEPIIQNYNEATDSIAHFICDFVESIPMVSYAPNVTKVNLALAAVRVQSLGYQLNVTGINTEPYNAEDMMDYLRFKKAILVMGGSGHCWTVEGGAYCLWPTPQPDKSKYFSTLFYCDWGWGGTNNGHYEGEVFNTEFGTYENLEYFAIFKDSILEILPPKQ